MTRNIFALNVAKCEAKFRKILLITIRYANYESPCSYIKPHIMTILSMPTTWRRNAITIEIMKLSYLVYFTNSLE